MDWGRLPPGRTVLVRGMGLNFFDLMVQVTEGRGGRFVPATDGEPLTYLPSGKEPRLVAGSRRGTPYRAKARIKSYIPAGVELRHFTTHAARLFAEAGVQPGFDHDLWPMLHRDVYWTYYSTLARVEPECLKVAPQELLAGLDHLLAEKWEPGNRTLLTPGSGLPGRAGQRGQVAGRGGPGQALQRAQVQRPRRSISRRCWTIWTPTRRALRAGPTTR